MYGVKRRFWPSARSRFLFFLEDLAGKGPGLESEDGNTGPCSPLTQSPSLSLWAWVTSSLPLVRYCCAPFLLPALIYSFDIDLVDGYHVTGSLLLRARGMQ